MLYFIVNKISGKGKGAETAQKIKDILNEKKIEFKMAFTEAKEHAVSLAREFSKKSDCTGIVAVGGDGTFSEVLNGIDVKKIPMGLVSSGSGNDFMRVFAPKQSLAEQLKPILENKTRRIDFLQVNDRRCLNVSGTGFDVDILIRERKLRRVLSGSMGYYASLIITLFTLKFRRFVMKVDGKSVDELALIMTMANGRYFGGGMPISPESEIDDGTLQLYLVKKMPLYRIPGMLIRFLKGRLKEIGDYVDVYDCTSVECAVSPEVEIQLDGELFKMPRFTATLCKGGLTVFG